MIFTIDVEDWGQSVLSRSNPVTNRVYDNTVKILELLSQHGHTATFFTLANVAEKHPSLIRQMINEGHEVASHGCNHHNLYTLSSYKIEQDIGRSVKILEDISGEKVLGFRAPNFSLRESLLPTYCKALSDNGLKYDSSQFQIPVIRHGIKNKLPTEIFEKYNIDIHYLSHMKVLNKEIPFFGGGYFRLFPYFLNKIFSKQVNSKNKAVFYMHPFELDTKERKDIIARYGQMDLIKNQYFLSRNSVEKKLHRLMTDFNFSSFEKKYYSGFEGQKNENTASHKNVEIDLPKEQLI